MARNLEGVCHLDEEQRFQLRDWLYQQKFPCCDLNTIYSDGHVMAKLINHLYPSFLDICLYPQFRSPLLKIRTWNKINVNALEKLQIYPTVSEIDQIARAVPGAAEKLLFELMLVQKSGYNPLSDTSSD